MNLDSLTTIFEPALLKEMQQFGIVQQFKEGDLIMDYGKYIRTLWHDHRSWWYVQY